MYQIKRNMENNLDQRKKSLLAKCETVECFAFEGVLFKGNKENAVAEYIKNNPSPSDMYVWLQDNYQLIR